MDGWTRIVAAERLTLIEICILIYKILCYHVKNLIF